MRCAASPTSVTRPLPQCSSAAARDNQNKIQGLHVAHARRNHTPTVTAQQHRVCQHAYDHHSLAGRRSSAFSLSLPGFAATVSFSQCGAPWNTLRKRARRSSDEARCCPVDCVTKLARPWSALVEASAVCFASPLRMAASAALAAVRPAGACMPIRSPLSGSRRMALQAHAMCFHVNTRRCVGHDRRVSLAY